MNSDNDLEKLIENLPVFLQEQIFHHQFNDQLIEIVLDLGRRPEIRLTSGLECLSQKLLSWQDLDYTTKRLGKFNNANRAGIEGTLHRVSCIRNRQFLIYGLTCRIGRSIFGAIAVIKDLLGLEKSILILGKPGVGKTTVIREIARVLSDEMEKRVVVIDTSNEIAGDNEIPHFGIGSARRMQVSKTELQHQVMIEAVKNHMPQVIIIDEIGTQLEVFAARTIAEKGVQLVGTTHGHSLENLIKNPPLADLIGGIQQVTISDEEAKKRKTQKSTLERKAYPAFEIIIEINSLNYWTIYENTESSVDFFLRNQFVLNQTRQFYLTDKIQIQCSRTKKSPSIFLVQQNKSFSSCEKSWLKYNKTEISKTEAKELIIYPYSLSINLLKEILKKIGIRVTFTNNIQKADFIIGLKKHLKQNLNLKTLAQKKKNSYLHYK